MKKSIFNSFNRVILLLTFAFAIGFISAPVFAVHNPYPHTQSVYTEPEQTTQSMIVPTLVDAGAIILIDNFEYFDSPHNHDWFTSDPAYPVWGFGIGYGRFQTLLDFAEGSRVMETYRASTVFMPYMERYRVTNNLTTTGPIPVGAGSYVWDPTHNGGHWSSTDRAIPGFPFVGFKVRAPVAIEHFDMFEFQLALIVGGDPTATPPVPGTPYIVSLVPREEQTNTPVHNNYAETAFLKSPPSANSPGLIEVKVGREISDGTWHIVKVDLRAIVCNALEGNESTVTPNSMVQTINGISLVGNEYRIDDIKFYKTDFFIGDNPYLFHIGEIYGQIFTTTERIICAGDNQTDRIYPGAMNGETNEEILLPIDLASRRQIAQIWFQDLSHDACGCCPNCRIAPGTDPLGLGFAPDATSLTDAQADAYIAAVESATLTLDGQTLSLFDVKRAILANLLPRTQTVTIGGTEVPAMALYAMVPTLIDDGMRTSHENHAEDMLRWTAQVSGIGERGMGTQGLLEPLSIFEAPRYIEIHNQNFGVDYTAKVLEQGTFYSHDESRGPGIPSIQAALINAGYPTWPNISKLSITPQTFETLIVTIRCSDGHSEDTEVFPIQIINTPITNYVPHINDIDDQMFDVGVPAEYIVHAQDPDSYIRTIGPDGDIILDFNDDQENLVWTAWLEGLPSYQYGPWTESLIDPMTGVISFTPMFEGVFTLYVQCRDPQGLTASIFFDLYCTNPNGWLNHSPIYLGGMDPHPHVMKAGELYRITNLDFGDPDHEPLYYSCNLGAIGIDSDGSVVWEFHTMYPGDYLVEVVGYDTRGGYVVYSEPIQVIPWWSI